MSSSRTRNDKSDQAAKAKLTSRQAARRAIEDRQISKALEIE